VQAVVNEDIGGDVGSLKEEVRRLKEQLAAYQSGERAQQAPAADAAAAVVLATPERATAQKSPRAPTPQRTPSYTPAV
jgi:hypothetical protein